MSTTALALITGAFDMLGVYAPGDSMDFLTEEERDAFFKELVSAMGG